MLADTPSSQPLHRFFCLFPPPAFRRNESFPRLVTYAQHREPHLAQTKSTCLSSLRKTWNSFVLSLGQVRLSELFQNACDGNRQIRLFSFSFIKAKKRLYVSITVKCWLIFFSFDLKIKRLKSYKVSALYLLLMCRFQIYFVSWYF